MRPFFFAIPVCGVGTNARALENSISNTSKAKLMTPFRSVPMILSNLRPPSHLESSVKIVAPAILSSKAALERLFLLVVVWEAVVQCLSVPWVFDFFCSSPTVRIADSGPTVQKCEATGDCSGPEQSGLPPWASHGLARLQHCDRPCSAHEGTSRAKRSLTRTVGRT